MMAAERTAICHGCTQPFSYKATGRRERKYHSQECYWADRRHNKMQGTLKRRCVVFMADHHLSRAEFIRQSGVGSVRYWFGNEDRLLSRPALEKLAAFLKISYELALEEMGGRTANDVKAGPPRVERVTVRCRRCPHATEVTRYRAQRFKTLEWTADGPTYVCHPCALHDKRSVTEPMVAGWRKLRRAAVPRSPLQERCLRYVDERGLSIGELARQTGVNPGSFRKFCTRGPTKLGPPTMSRANLKRLAKVLGISIEQAIDEAGGQTREQRSHEIGLARATENRTDERRTKMAEFGHRQKGRAKPAAATAGMAKMSRSTRMKVVFGLFARIMRGAPTPENLQRWARVVAEKNRVSVAEVSNLWRPHLKKRGLHMKIGRPGVDERVKQQRVKAIADAAGNLTSALTQIQALEGNDGLTSSESLRVWLWRERKREA